MIFTSVVLSPAGRQSVRTAAKPGGLTVTVLLTVLTRALAPLVVRAAGAISALQTTTNMVRAVGRQGGGGAAAKEGVLTGGHLTTTTALLPQLVTRPSLSVQLLKISLEEIILDDQIGYYA